MSEQNQRVGIPNSYPVLRSIEKLGVTLSRVIGELASWAVQQSPYPVPDKLAEALTGFREFWPLADYAEFKSIRDLEDAIRATFQKVPEILAWNERKNGREGMGFATRYSEPNPDDDFIDLDALVRNIAMATWHDAADFKSFNDDFDRRHPTPATEEANQQ